MYSRETVSSGSDPGRSAIAVTPSDTSDFCMAGNPCRSLLVMTDGNVKFLPVDNADSDPVGPLTYKAGNIIPFSCRRVFATDTTATVRAIY